MGDSITEGALVKWLKSACYSLPRWLPPRRLTRRTPADKGDYVALDEIVLVIETDKVAVDVRAPVSGILEETLAAVGA